MQILAGKIYKIKKGFFGGVSEKVSTGDAISSFKGEFWLDPGGWIKIIETNALETRAIYINPGLDYRRYGRFRLTENSILTLQIDDLGSRLVLSSEEELQQTKEAIAEKAENGDLELDFFAQDDEETFNRRTTIMLINELRRARGQRETIIKQNEKISEHLKVLICRNEKRGG